MNCKKHGVTLPGAAKKPAKDKSGESA